MDYIVTMFSKKKTRIVVIIIKGYISLANLLGTDFEINLFNYLRLLCQIQPQGDSSFWRRI